MYDLNWEYCTYRKPVGGSYYQYFCTNHEELRKVGKWQIGELPFIEEGKDCIDCPCFKTVNKLAYFLRLIGK